MSDEFRWSSMASELRWPILSAQVEGGRWKVKGSFNVLYVDAQSALPHRLLTQPN